MPLTVSVPVPCLTTAPVPEITPLIVPVVPLTLAVRLKAPRPIAAAVRLAAVSVVLAPSVIASP